MKTVLVLGAGLVAGPLVRYLLDVPDFEVIVASRTVRKAAALVNEHPQGKAQGLDVENDPEALRALVPQADLAISLLPYAHHAQVAELCIEFGRDMVTTSYVSAAMRALDERAKAKEVTLLNEIGVDPGIDHMSAMKIIHTVQQQDGEITSFRSWCGGLPAPEANTNPLGYKFSWSPRGVLLAGRNAAHYLENGEEITISGEDLFDHHWPVTVPGMDILEGYPNRDAMPYAEMYSIPTAQTVFRGTLRNPGWSATLKTMVDIGLLGLDQQDWSGMCYKDLIATLIGFQGDDTRRATAKHVGLEKDSFILGNFEWLGLFSTDPLPIDHGAPVDILTARMMERMAYQERERDMLLMHHEFTAQYSDRTEEITSTMIDYGIPGGDSSMSRTVGLPAAIASRLILEGEIQREGVLTPVTPDIYESVLSELAVNGIHLTDVVRRI